MNRAALLIANCQLPIANWWFQIGLLNSAIGNWQSAIRKNGLSHLLPAPATQSLFQAIVDRAGHLRARQLVQLHCRSGIGARGFQRVR